MARLYFLSSSAYQVLGLLRDVKVDTCHWSTCSQGLQHTWYLHVTLLQKIAYCKFVPTGPRPAGACCKSAHIVRVRLDPVDFPDGCNAAASVSGAVSWRVRQHVLWMDGPPPKL